MSKLTDVEREHAQEAGIDPKRYKRLQGVRNIDDWNRMRRREDVEAKAAVEAEAEIAREAAREAAKS